MIWPLTSLTAGQMMLLAIIVFVLVAEDILVAVYKKMDEEGEKTVLDALEDEDEDTLKKMLKNVDSILPELGKKAIIGLLVFGILMMYMFAKMFMCSCACNNCP